MIQKNVSKLNRQEFYSCLKNGKNHRKITKIDTWPLVLDNYCTGSAEIWDHLKDLI